ncbi:endonuclease/exonuclease/phosphatase family protein [Mycobacterium sp. C3-094]
MRAFLSRQRRRLTWMLRPQRTIDTAAFDIDRNRWVAVTDAVPVERDELSVATFNIWFSDYHATARYQAIVDLLETYTPDVIALQEVTAAALDVFLGRPCIRKNYQSVAATGRDFGNYGLLILSRLPVSHAVYTHLPHSVGRGLLRANLTVNGQELAVCSLHLQSGKNASTIRAHQLDAVFRIAGTTENVVLCGDFNLRDTENVDLPADCADAWATLHPNEEGFTENTSVNLMLYDNKRKHRGVRFDRVLITGDQWAPACIDLLGTEPISRALPRVFPSDHFGLLCRIVHTGGGDGSAVVADP